MTEKNDKILGGFKKALLQNPPRNDSGSNFQGSDSGSAHKSQSYRPKVGVTDQKSEIQPERRSKSEPTRPEKEPKWRLGASTESPLKAFLNPDKLKPFSSILWELYVCIYIYICAGELLSGPRLGAFNGY